MVVNNIISTDEAQSGFYPTPPSVASLLLDGIEWRKVSDVLEPSAGKGDLVRQIIKEYRQEYGRWDNMHVRVDCIEVDPYLRSIIKYEYCGQKSREMLTRIKELEKKKDWNQATRSYGKLTEEEQAELDDLKEEKKLIETAQLCIVHDDFLTFDSRKSYNVIVMNPPFANGDEHLLKAIRMQEQTGGEIRCILNAETIRNPYTNRRQILARKLQELNATVDFVENGFSDSERKTNVEIAVIKISVPAPHRESNIFDRLRKAAEAEEPIQEDVTDLTVTDFMEKIVRQFNVEVDAGLSLINEYKAMQPYILKSFSKEGACGSPTISVTVSGDNNYNSYPSINNYIKLVRAKYWEALFSNKEFVGRLTNNLREQYSKKITALADYDFTVFNISQIAEEMSAEMSNGIQETIVKLFDKLTEEHSWYPECAKNIHYYNGWKTNKAHKVNSKVIVPTYGVFADLAWSKKTFNVREAESLIADIEKVFNYLDGNRTENVDLHNVLLDACEAGQTKNIQCKYFEVTLYKKGTMHIKFRDQSIIDRFNIFCCRQKNWLPPTYGNIKYEDMTNEERDTVDGFNGDGTSGSGADGYSKILMDASYYLSSPTEEIKMLAAPNA